MAVDQLRRERDRFVAFAFAAADVLIELDSEYRVCYAAGATRALFGADPDDLLGDRLLDHLSPQGCERLGAVLAAIPTGKRMAPTSVCLRKPGLPAVEVTGYHVPEIGGRYYIALSIDKQSAAIPAKPAAAAAERDAETGLLDKDSFGAVAGDRIEAGKAAGADYELTLIDLNDLEPLRDRIDAESARSFLAHLGQTLRENSVDGDSAGRFDGGTYGLVHERSLDVEALRSRISGMGRRIDPEGIGFDVSAATVRLDDDGANSPEDIGKAVLYTINKFSERQGDAFTITSLSQGCELMLEDTVARISRFRIAVSKGEFNVALQPIVDLKTGGVHHYEALVRFDELGAAASPYALITFAEETGVIGDLDLAMTGRAIAMLANAEKRGRDLSLAVNLSGRSLSSPAFVEELLALLESHPLSRDKLYFEITESSRIGDLEAMNELIQLLRRAGHAVCLDDFGSGAAAFQYLRALTVDLVKIDGLYVREALTTPTGKPFFKAMVGLCRDLDIAVVAEMVEDQGTVRFVRECGVRFAQGYLFGAPVVTDKPPPAGGKTDANRRPPPSYLDRSRTVAG